MGSSHKGTRSGPPTEFCKLPFKSASRWCRNLRAVKSQTLGAGWQLGGGTSWRERGRESVQASGEWVIWIFVPTGGSISIRDRREFFISERFHNTCRIKNNNKNKRINNKKTRHRTRPPPLFGSERRKSLQSKGRIVSLPLHPGWKLIRGGWKGRSLDQKLIWSLETPLWGVGMCIVADSERAPSPGPGLQSESLAAPSPLPLFLSRFFLPFPVGGSPPHPPG